MHTDFNGTYFSCDVPSLLGAVSFIMFIGSNNKGLCHSDAHFLFFSYGTSHKIVSTLFVQVWVATESGNLEVTYTHKEEHVRLFLQIWFSCVLHVAFHLY